MTVRYTARHLTLAARPVVLTIGRARGSWWRRLAVRWCRTWTARPLSVPQMLRVQSAEPLERGAVFREVLREVLPWRAWYVLTGDPVAMLMALPETLQRHVLRELVMLPGTDEDATRPEVSLIERIRAEQRAAVHGQDAGAAPRPTLAVAALSVRATFGDAWYFNPARWQTADGYAPFAVAWIEWVGLDALRARRTLELSHAFVLPSSKDFQRRLSTLQREAYPTDRIH